MEIINSQIPRGGFRVALLDFDGTLSLIRRGWQEVMVSYFVEVLLDLHTGESRSELRQLVETFVAELTGKQTIYQAIRLSEEVEKRGHSAENPLHYKHTYHDRLWNIIASRIEALESGSTPPDEWLLPGARALLENLRRRGICLYLASGTDLQFVEREARLLQIDQYFEGRIFGALDEYRRFSKAQLIRSIFSEFRLAGPELLGIGDGYVEVVNTKEAGGVAVGVASNEASCDGWDEWKRQRLTSAGADILIPEFRAQEILLKYLFND